MSSMLLSFSCTQESGGSDPVAEGGVANTPAPGPSTRVQVFIERTAGQADLTDELPISFTATFSRAIQAGTFVGSDLQNLGDAANTNFSVSRLNSQTYRISVLSTDEGNIFPFLPQDSVLDNFGNGNFPSLTTGGGVRYSLGFGVSIEQRSTQTDPTKTFPIEFDLEFEFPINPTTFTIADITQSGTSTGVTWNIINSGDNQNYIIQALSADQEGTIVPTIAAELITLPTLEVNSPSLSVDNSVTYAPDFGVTIEQSLTQLDPTELLPINFDVVFSVPIDPATFTSADIIQNGGAPDLVWSIVNSGDDQNFTLQLTNASDSGLVIPSIAASTVKSALGADNLDSTSADNSVLYAQTFEVTINQAAAQLDPASGFNISYDVVFEKAIDPSTFTPSDITQLGSATGVNWNIVNSGDDINFTLTATAATSEGTIAPFLAYNSVQNSINETNADSTSTDNVVLYRTSFSATIEQATIQTLDPTGSLPIYFDVSFGEAIDPTSFTPTDITQTGTATDLVWTVTNTGDNQNFLLTLTEVNGDDGTVIPTIISDMVTAAIDPTVGNADSTSVDNTVDYNTSQVLTLTIIDSDTIDADGVSTTRLRVNVKDVLGLNIAGASVSLNIPPNGGSVDVSPQVTNAGGNVTFTITSSTVAGVYSYTATGPESDSNSVDVTFSPGPVAAVTLSVTGASEIAADASSTTTLEALLEDAFGNAVPLTSATLSIPTDGGTSTLTTDSNASGIASYTLTSSLVLGTYSYTVTSNSITSNAVDVDFIAGPVAAVTLTVTGASSIVADGVETTTIEVLVEDALGNPAEGRTVNLTIPTNGGSVVSVNLVSDAAGLVTYTLTSSTVTGIYNYTANSNAVTSNLENVTFVAGPPAAITLTRTGNYLIGADEIQSTTFQATVKDAFNNDVPNFPVTLNIPANGGTTTNPSNTNASGVVNFTLVSSLVEGIYSYTATAGAVSSNSQDAEFKAAELSWDQASFVYPCGNTTQQFTLTNIGEALSGTINIALVAGGGTTGAFSIAVNNCGGTTLDKNESCTVSVNKSDQGTFLGGCRNGTRVLRATAAPGGTADVNLSF